MVLKGYYCKLFTAIVPFICILISSAKSRTQSQRAFRSADSSLARLSSNPKEMTFSLTARFYEQYQKFKSSQSKKNIFLDYLRVSYHRVCLQSLVTIHRILR